MKICDTVIFKLKVYFNFFFYRILIINTIIFKFNYEKKPLEKFSRAKTDLL